MLGPCGGSHYVRTARAGSCMTLGGVDVTTSALGAALRRALDQDRPEVARLSYAQTTVRFTITDAARESTTLLLDRTPAEVMDADTDAEVEVLLTADQAADYACGRLALTAELLAGRVRAVGPVRSVLEIDPILRTLLGGDVHGAVADDLHGARRSPRLTPDPDLLAIETRNLHKSLGGRAILRGIDLQVPEGMVSVVLGPSGTGKSVLLNHVLGLMRPDAGDVLVRGRSLGGMARAELLELRSDIGVMFQDGALFSTMDIYDNVAFPLRQHTDLSEAEISEVVRHRLGEVGLAGVERRFPAQLSGGMRKRAGLARALVLDPNIVLCDEPDSGLDPVRTALLADLLAEEHATAGGTMVIVTHNIALARQVGEYISVLWQGEVVESGPADAVFAPEDPFVRQFLAGETTGPLSMDA